MFPVSDVIPSRTTPVVTIALIAVNAAAFVYELYLGDRIGSFVRTFGLVPAMFSWPAILTSMFLHQGWIHFLGNVLYLWIFCSTCSAERPRHSPTPSRIPPRGCR